MINVSGMKIILMILIQSLYHIINFSPTNAAAPKTTVSIEVFTDNIKYLFSFG